MTENYVFKIMEKQNSNNENDILLIIENDTLKFMTDIKEETFNLPYLRNKDLTKFLSKIIDKFNDQNLKFDYSVKIIDTNKLLFKVYYWDGSNHNYDIILKSKEIRDSELLDLKFIKVKNDIQTDYNNKIDNLESDYNNKVKFLQSDYNQKILETKTSILNKVNNDKYRNYTYKSLKIIKSTSKITRFFNFLEENNIDNFINPDTSFINTFYSYSINNENFNKFIKQLLNDNVILDHHKKFDLLKKYMVDLDVYNTIEFIINYFGYVNILNLNIDFNKPLCKLTIELKILYDISDKRHYKCYKNLFNKNLNNSRLIYQIDNSYSNLKKELFDIYIFEYLENKNISILI